MLLVDITPAYEYKDSHRLDKLGVKIDGKQFMEKPDGFAEVEFTGLEVFAYESQGKTQISARAAGITLVD